MNNISRVSFGSTYIVKAKDNTNEAYWNAASTPLIDDSGAKVIPSYIPGEEVSRIIIGDKYDTLMESYFKQNNIVFHKKTNEELFDVDNVKTRIVVPKKYGPDRFLPTTVNINVKNFDKIFKNSFQYLGDYETMRAKERYDGVREYIKTGLPIDAPEVYVREKDGKPEVSFQDGTHRYAFFRDMGMKSMPVAMDLKSFNTAIKYRLIGG